MTCTLDFPHAAAWCPACYAESQTNALIAEAKRANDLKAEELGLRERYGWVESSPPPPPPPQRTYMLPAPATTPKNTQRYGEKGGIRIDHRG